MGFLVPRHYDLTQSDHTEVDYELDRYVLVYGRHGYLRRHVMDHNTLQGVEWLEVKSINFANPATLPGPTCGMRTLYGRKPYVVTLAEHPHALYLAQHQLCYNVGVSQFWQRERTKPLPDVDIIYGNAFVGFFSPSPPPEEGEDSSD